MAAYLDGDCIRVAPLMVDTHCRVEGKDSDSDEGPGSTTQTVVTREDLIPAAGGAGVVAPR
jgi:hypothetical protein